MQLPQIAAVEQPAHHVRRDLVGALLVKLVPGRELELTIGAGQRSLEAGMEEIAGLDHDHAGGAAVGMAVIQPEQGHGLSVAGWPGGREGLALVCASAWPVDPERPTAS